MKLKVWQFEYEFDRDDAKIVVPIILLVLALSTTDLSPPWLLLSAGAYYLFYFFAKGTAAAFAARLKRMRMRCPRCKSKKILLQGYQEYKSDELYAYYFCDRCKTTSILTDGGLMEI